MAAGHGCTARHIRSGILLFQPDPGREGKGISEKSCFRDPVEGQLYAYPSVEFLGYMAPEINKSSLYDIIADIDLSEDGRMFLVNEEGRIVVSKDGAQTGEPLDTDYMKCFDGKEAFYENVSVEGVPYSVYVSRPTTNNWHILLALPRADYMRDISNLRNIVIVITAIIILLAVFAFLFISKSTTSSIQTLVHSMEDFGQGNFEVNCRIDSEDEIGRLGQAFNKMVNYIRTHTRAPVSINDVAQNIKKSRSYIAFSSTGWIRSFGIKISDSASSISKATVSLSPYL